MRRAFVFAWITLMGCASASTRTDMSRVQELVRDEGVANVQGPIEPLTADEVRQLLQKPLDVDTAVRIALLNNRELRATLRDVGVERGQLMQAGVIGNPLLEAELLPERNSMLELRVEYGVTSLILAPVRAKAASFDLEAARYRAAGAIVQTGFDVRAAFYAAQAAEARLRIARTILASFAAARDAAQALFESGNTRELDLSIQTTAYERARISVAQLELDLADANERLQRLLGLYGDDTQWTLSGALPEPPRDLQKEERLEARIVEASLDLREVRSRLEGLARKAGYSQLRGWLPEISVDGHALYGNPETNAQSDPSRGDWRFGAGISLGLPIFDQQRGTTRSYEAQRDALLERYYGLAIALRSSARAAHNHMRSAYVRAKQYQDTIAPAQAKVTEQSLLQYNAMQIGVFELLQARREQLDIALAQIETLREFWTAKAALDGFFAGRRVLAQAPAAVPVVSSETTGGGH